MTAAGHSTEIVNGDDGWVEAVCSCGESSGAVPVMVEAVDWIMDHGRDVGR